MIELKGPKDSEQNDRNRCLICDRKFKYKDKLRYHIRNIHEGKKPFKCSICFIGYVSKSALNFHTKTVHDEEKPFLNNLYSVPMLKSVQ